MPRLDKTGPAGKGPKTGRGLGNCEPSTPSRQSKGTGVGTGRGSRRVSTGRGNRRK